MPSLRTAHKVAVGTAHPITMGTSPILVPGARVMTALQSGVGAPPDPCLCSNSDLSERIPAPSVATCIGRAQRSVPHGARRGSVTARNLSAFPMTETDDRLMAAAAIIGLRSRPVQG